MAQPPKYVRTADFSQDEANNVAGRSTVLTASLDAELDNVATSLNAAIDNLGQIQRDDLKLRDKIVEPHTLSDAVKAVVGAAWNPRGVWASGTAYAVRDVVEQGGTSYVCTTAHTSGASFSADYSAGYWIAVSTARLSGATAGNLPSITATGDLQDSGLVAAQTPQLDQNETVTGRWTFNIGAVIDDASNPGNGLILQASDGGFTEFRYGTAWRGRVRANATDGIDFHTYDGTAWNNHISIRQDGSLVSVKPAAAGYTRVGPNFCRINALAWVGFDTTTGNKSWPASGTAPNGAKLMVFMFHQYLRSDGTQSFADQHIRAYTGDAINRYGSQTDYLRSFLYLGASPPASGQDVLIAPGHLLVPVQDDGRCYFDVIRFGSSQGAFEYTPVGYFD